MDSKQTEQFNKDLKANEDASDALDAELNKPDLTKAVLPKGALVNSPEVLDAKVLPSSVNQPLAPSSVSTVTATVKPAVKPSAVEFKKSEPVKPTASVSTDTLFSDQPVRVR